MNRERQQSQAMPQQVEIKQNNEELMRRAQQQLNKMLIKEALQMQIQAQPINKDDLKLKQQLELAHSQAMQSIVKK